MPTYALNKKAKFDYEILQTFEAGLVLTGPEVKSVRAKQIKLMGAYVTISHGECFLRQAHISPYEYSSHAVPHEAERPRKLLLKKQEIAYLQGKLEEKGLTIVPLAVYSKGSHVKIEIGIARGKKQYDKRETIKKRDIERDMRRAMKE